MTNYTSSFEYERDGAVEIFGTQDIEQVSFAEFNFIKLI